MSRRAARIGRNGGPRRINTGLLRVTVHNDGTMTMRSTQVIGASGICATAADAIECLNASPWGRTTIVNDDDIIDAVEAYASRKRFVCEADAILAAMPVAVRADVDIGRLEEIPGMAELEFAI